MVTNRLYAYNTEQQNNNSKKEQNSAMLDFKLKTLQTINYMTKVLT